MAAGGQLINNMRKLFLFFVLAFCGCLCSYGQNVRKELNTEEDGFKWYLLYDNRFHGAESLNGEILIPLSKKYDYVQYRSPLLLGLYNSHKPGVIYKTEYYTKEGKEVLDNSKYDDTTLLGGEDGVPFYFLTKKDGKQGACDFNGNEIVPALFTSCFYDPNDKEFNIQDTSGYHKWSEYKATTYNTSSSNTYSSNSTSSNQSTNIKEMFDLAYNTPDTEAQTKYNRYVQVIQADPYNSYGYKAVAYNNLGVLYETLGDLNNAKACYEYALQANPNYDKAKDNLKNVKAQRRSQRWNNISNALGAVGQALGTMSGGQTNGTYNTYQGDGGSFSGSSGGYPDGSGNSNCKRCQGSGRCSSKSGTANKYYCHGSGKCGYCNGSGIVRKLGQTITCTACNGRGRCEYCNGSGKCSDCGGSRKR